MSTTPGDSSDRPVSDAPAEQSSESSVPIESATSHEVPVRRVPKYQTFLLIGVIVGLVAAMILTFAFQRSPQEIDPSSGDVYFSPGQVFGFLLLISIPVGVAIFGLLAWILDVRARKKTHTVRVDKVNVRVSEPDAEAPHTAGSSDKEDNL
ncbi:hypothetical protein [Paramicrobacterium agarici]|uniref:hypothetical protein n=1 Tax=Paramicrobacterium agarici TaxID=630514 RepID=UPI001168211F|nr:hypothetical protein [Microbacterium agarici]TQO23390.1 hypothetical protein FB385_2240 [Microbacterium agarici]